MLAVLLLAFFSCISAQSPPTFSEQFFSIVHVYVDQSGQKSSGKGQWLCNQPEGMNLETYEFDEQKHYHENIFLLQRWDLGSQYELQTGSNKTGCQVTPLTGSMPSLWSWVSLATNTRNITWGHETLLVWSYSAGGAIIEVVVSEYDSNTPRWLFRNSSNENFAIEFRVWQVTDIPSKDFAVPKQCSSTNNLPVKKPSAGSPAAGWTKYMQCDSAWGNDQLGTCNLNICQAGCAMSCVAMALTTKGHSIDPGQLNDWLKSNGGYESGCDIVWSAVDAFGVMKFISMENAAYDTICDGVKAGHAIIINVRDGTHWVLVTGCSGGNYLVNDPYFSVNSYSPGDVLTEAVYH